MRILISALFIFGVCSAQAAGLIVKVVEEGTSGASDIKAVLKSKEQSVWEKHGWVCKAQLIGKDWGIFRCTQSNGFEVSTRFNCNKHKSFDDSRSFRIADKKELNTTFSLWCE